MVSDRDYLTLRTIVLFEVIVLIAAYLKSYMVDMQSHSPDLKAFCQRVERIWSILLTEGVKNLACEAIDKGGKGKLMVESSNMIPWESTSSARPFNFCCCCLKNVPIC